jgi:hypothetical protein
MLKITKKVSRLVISRLKLTDAHLYLFSEALAKELVEISWLAINRLAKEKLAFFYY